MLEQFRAVERAPIIEATDESINLAGKLCGELMALPAPDNAAMVWKLDYLLEPHRSWSSPSWRKDFIMQAIVDYHCILGDAA